MRFLPIFIANLFLSLHYGAVLYVHSSLLGNFFSTSAISFLFLFGALLNILLFLFAPRFIERMGKKALLILSLALIAGATSGLGLAPNAFFVAFVFLVYAGTLPIASYCLDIFLEELSRDTNTGEIRGAYLTTANFGIAVGPLILALFADGENLRGVYLAAFALLIPAVLIVISRFRSSDPKWHTLHHRALLPFKNWWHTKGVRHATISRLILELFFAIMVVYLPVYLHENVGFDWNTIGIMFAIMLLPFILFQWPVGEFADRFFGEKEFMIYGFLIMGITLFFMPKLGESAVWWTLALFFSRVGASFVEVTTDSYFFKKVDHHDTGLLSIFRLTRPTGLILGTLVGFATIGLFSFETIFYILAVIIFFGLKETLAMRDTL